MSSTVSIFANDSSAHRFKNASTLEEMPYIKEDLNTYKSCKGHQLHCATKIFNRISDYEYVMKKSPLGRFSLI